METLRIAFKDRLEEASNRYDDYSNAMVKTIDVELDQYGIVESEDNLIIRAVATSRNNTSIIISNESDNDEIEETVLFDKEVTYIFNTSVIDDAKQAILDYYLNNHRVNVIAEDRTLFDRLLTQVCRKAESRYGISVNDFNRHNADAVIIVRPPKKNKAIKINISSNEDIIYDLGNIVDDFDDIVLYNDDDEIIRFGDDYTLIVKVKDNDLHTLFKLKEKLMNIPEVSNIKFRYNNWDVSATKPGVKRKEI